MYPSPRQFHLQARTFCNLLVSSHNSPTLWVLFWRRREEPAAQLLLLTNQVDSLIPPTRKLDNEFRWSAVKITLYHTFLPHQSLFFPAQTCVFNRIKARLDSFAHCTAQRGLGVSLYRRRETA